MSRSRVVLAVLFFAALMVPSGPASASSSLLCTGYASCSSKGYPHGGYATAQSRSYWNMYTGTNCTNYVAYRLVATNGMPNQRPKSGVGNAQDWGRAMASITDSRPAVGSVAWWGRTGHHVAYVEKVVSPTEIIVSESNWSGAFDWRRITASGSGWPDGFIHFADTELRNTSSPTLGSTPRVGVPLTPSVGRWTVMGNTYAYRWTADGATISGATAKSYTPTADVIGKDLALTVTASRPGYASGTATSARAEVAPGSFAPAAPTVSGTGRVDDPLTASAGAWSPQPSSLAYQWSVDGTPVVGATGPTFSPRPDDVDRAVTVRVTGTRAGYSAASTTSAPTTVTPGVVASTARPTVSGTPAVGSVLTARPGTWSTDGLAYRYQWFADGAPLDGATGATYTPAPADRGRELAVRVTAGRAGYLPASATSAGTSAVAAGTLRPTTPTISGSTRLGSPVTVVTGPAPAPGATATVQWFRSDAVITGATVPDRKVVRNDLGTRLSARVTWSAPGYEPASLTTAPAATSKAQARLKVTPTASTRSVRFAVALPVAGLADPTATVVVSRKGGGSVRFTVKDGRGTLTLSRQPVGKQTYTFTYAGTSTITSADVVVTARVR